MNMLADSPFWILAGLFVFGVLLHGFFCLWEQRKRKKMQMHSRLSAQPCPACGRTYGDTLSIKALDLWPMGRSRDFDVPSWLWVVTCPHCGSETRFTKDGIMYSP